MGHGEAGRRPGKGGPLGTQPGLNRGPLPASRLVLPHLKPSELPGAAGRQAALPAATRPRSLSSSQTMFLGTVVAGAPPCGNHGTPRLRQRPAGPEGTAVALSPLPLRQGTSPSLLPQLAKHTPASGPGPLGRPSSEGHFCHGPHRPSLLQRPPGRISCFILHSTRVPACPPSRAVSPIRTQAPPGLGQSCAHCQHPGRMGGETLSTRTYRLSQLL